jgi:protein gp37
VSKATKIEWTDTTWNPVRGCSKVSEGCRNCYAERQAGRFSGKGQPWHGFAERRLGRAFGNAWTGKVALISEKLYDPLKWRKPRRVFVNSMSDLFEKNLPDEAIDKVFAVMAQASQHTFQVLTKRPGRMREWFTRTAGLGLGLDGQAPLRGAKAFANAEYSWPLPNVWLGVSIEDQATADERIPHLLGTPAAKRFVSYEPALGPVQFRPEWLRPSTRHHLKLDIEGAVRNRSFDGFTDPETGRDLTRAEAEAALRQELQAGKRFLLVGDSCEGFSEQSGCPGHRTPGLDQVIVGGESGPGARPCDVAWIRSAVQQCKAAGVAAFVKQLQLFKCHVCGNCWEKMPSWDAEECDGCVRRARRVLSREPSEWPADLQVREVPK